MSETMDPVRNPFTPGAGQRPPELAGRTVNWAPTMPVSLPMISPKRFGMQLTTCQEQHTHLCLGKHNLLSRGER
jgi:hypothetical protein